MDHLIKGSATPSLRRVGRSRESGAVQSRPVPAPMRGTSHVSHTHDHHGHTHDHSDGRDHGHTHADMPSFETHISDATVSDTDLSPRDISRRTVMLPLAS